MVQAVLHRTFFLVTTSTILFSDHPMLNILHTSSFHDPLLHHIVAIVCPPLVGLPSQHGRNVHRGPKREGRLEMAKSGRVEPSHQGGRKNHLSIECGNLRHTMSPPISLCWEFRASGGMQLSVVQIDHDDSEFECIEQVEITGFLCFPKKRTVPLWRHAGAMIYGLLWRDMRSIGPFVISVLGRLLLCGPSGLTRLPLQQSHFPSILPMSTC